MKSRSESSRYGVGDLVRFKKVKKTRISGQLDWIDADENHIPPGIFGLIISARWTEDDQEACWEYDISIPELGIVTYGWSDYAFVGISEKKKQRK